MFPLGLAAIGSAILGYKSADKAADAQQASSEAAIREQQRQYNTALQLLEPQRNMGYQALGDIASLYGYSLPGYQPYQQILGTAGAQAQPDAAYEPGMVGAIGGTANRLLNRMRAGSAPTATAGAIPPQAAGQPGNMSRFFASPDYEFRRKEGERGIAASFAAKGGGGRALQSLADYNSNLASGEYGNYMNRLFNIAGMNQTATNSAIGAGSNYANNYGNLQQSIGDARASGAIGQSNAITGSLNNMLGLYMMNQWAGGGGGSFNPDLSWLSRYTGG